MSELKIMNWNIFWGLGYPSSKVVHILKAVTYFRKRSNKRNIQKIAELINEFSPDILTLQEVDVGSKRNGNFNQVKALSNLTNLKHNYFAVEKDWIGYFSDGNAILSKYDFQKVESKILPFNLEKRNYILSKIKIENKTITIITTHLGAHQSNQKERMEQVKELCKIINKVTTPIILIGDLNCEPTSKEFIFLKENSKLKPLINKPTYFSFQPQKIFDQIMISKDISVKSSKIINAKASDHFPVFAHLKF